MSSFIPLNELELFLRLLLAAVLGWCIGFERETIGKAAGTRTFSLVALGSALFSVVSSEGFKQYLDLQIIDPSRIASYILVGIGFIGGGLIVLREGRTEGLTTASALWVTAAIGLTIGRGLYHLSIFAFLLVIILLFTMRWLHPEKWREKQ